MRHLLEAGFFGQIQKHFLNSEAFFQKDLHTGVIVWHRPKQCTIQGKILQIYHSFVVFHFPPNGSHLMIPVHKRDKLISPEWGQSLPKMRRIYGLFTSSLPTTNFQGASLLVSGRVVYQKLRPGREDERMFVAHLRKSILSSASQMWIFPGNYTTMYLLYIAHDIRGCVQYGGIFRKQLRAEISSRLGPLEVGLDTCWCCQKKIKALQISIFKKIVNPICPMELEYLPTHLS